MFKKTLLAFLVLAAMAPVAWGLIGYPKGPPGTTWSRDGFFNIPVGTLTAGLCLGMWGYLGGEYTCSDHRAQNAVPDGYQLHLSHLNVVATNDIGANERCDLYVDAGIFDSAQADGGFGVGDATLGSWGPIEIGDGSDPDIDDEGDNGTLSIGETITGPAWVRVRIEQRAVDCTELTTMNLQLVGTLTQVP